MNRATSTFRAAFDCLWCGRPWTTRGPNDLEGWAQLCPECLGKAGGNRFLRDRLRAAIEARGRSSDDPGPGRVPASGVQPTSSSATAHASGATAPARPSPARPSPARPSLAPPAFPDDWFFRRGLFSTGAIGDTAWTTELDALTRWLDSQPLHGTILEPAAGVGFFSPLLATRGELRAYEADEAAADLVRDRLLAHGLRAHLHVRDPWTAPPDEPRADVLVAAFTLGRVRGAGVETVLRGWRDRLVRGGRLLVAELTPEDEGGPPPGTAYTFHDDETLLRTLRRAGFTDPRLGTTGRFFRHVEAVAD